MTITVRFAPSPTGLMHIGNARMALVNWLYARKMGGTLILRLDDTDRERSTPEYADALLEDLRWLGLHWDRLERQSERLAAYDSALERLKQDGRVYPCFETPEELEYKRRRALRAGKPPIYDRAALNLTQDEIDQKICDGENPHWRFRLKPEEIRFEDLVRGPVSFQGGKLSDPVLVRGDGTYLYMLPSATDDADMGVTHVIRGEDHVTNSAIQIQLFEALGAPVPTFAHLSLLSDATGGGLSKRAGSPGLRDLRQQGMEAMAVNSLLASLGTSDDIEPCRDLHALASAFDISRFGRAAPKFDVDRLRVLNARMIHDTPLAQISERLKEQGMDNVSEIFWEAVRPNLKKLEDCRIWYDVCYSDTVPVIAPEDADFMATASESLPDGPWDESTWGRWTAVIREQTGRKGKSLFLPLRLALTGLDHGPELKSLLPLIGPERAISRLAGKTA